MALIYKDRKPQYNLWDGENMYCDCIRDKIEG